MKKFFIYLLLLSVVCHAVMALKCYVKKQEQPQKEKECSEDEDRCLTIGEGKYVKKRCADKETAEYERDTAKRRMAKVAECMKDLCNK